MESNWLPHVCTVAIKAADGPGTVASTQMASISFGTPLPALDLCGHALQQGCCDPEVATATSFSSWKQNPCSSAYETYRLLLPMSLIWEYIFSWGIPSQFKFLQEIQSLISNSLLKKYTKTHTFLFFCFTLGLPWGKEQSGLFLIAMDRRGKKSENRKIS